MAACHKEYLLVILFVSSILVFAFIYDTVYMEHYQIVGVASRRQPSENHHIDTTISLNSLESQPNISFYLLKLSEKQNACDYSQDVMLLLHYLSQHPLRTNEISANTIFSIAFFGTFNPNHHYITTTEFKEIDANCKKYHRENKKLDQIAIFKQYISKFNALRAKHNNTHMSLLLITYHLRSSSMFNNAPWPDYIGRITFNTFEDNIYYQPAVDISLPTATYNSFYYRYHNYTPYGYKYNISFQGVLRPTYGSWWFNNKPMELDHGFSDKIYNLTQLSVKNRIANIRYKISKYLGSNGNDANGTYTDDDYRIFISKNPKLEKYIYDYNDIMTRSHFCLVLGGDSIWTYRLMEILSAGCIPIFIDNGWILPFNNIIKWSEFIITIKETTINELIQNRSLNRYNFKKLVNIKRRMHKKSLSQWHQDIFHLYATHFINYSVITNNLIQDIISSPYSRSNMNHLAS